MIQLGIRLHDVNTACSSELQTMEARADTARREGFSCVHLAYSKVIPGFAMQEESMTSGLAGLTRRIFQRRDMDVAVLGCYLNLANPDGDELKSIQACYRGHIRTAALLGAGVVGTETGCPNREYRTDRDTHSDEALLRFQRGLEPVLDWAEQYGVSLAIEPVWKHIVYDADRARQVLDSMQSSNLRIIFDPVNLLYPGNTAQRERIFSRTTDLLADAIDVVHLKDYVTQGDHLKSVAAGTGEMDYRSILKFLRSQKPGIYATLENTVNDNAEHSRQFLQDLYGAC